TINSMPAEPLLTVTGGRGTDSVWADEGLSIGETYFYWLKSVDSSENTSASVALNATPGYVKPADAATYAKDLVQIFRNTIALRGDSWTNNSPEAGSISWNAHTVLYR